jgi:hypothetical protein
MKRFLVEVAKGRLKIHSLVQEVGQDILVSIWGGTRPHIGAIGIAVPRPSLKDPKRRSATSSNFTFVGHKEDALVKEISEKLSAQLERNVVVTAGVHWDDITSREIRSVGSLLRKMSAQIIRRLKGNMRTISKNGTHLTSLKTRGKEEENG